MKKRVLLLSSLLIIGLGAISSCGGEQIKIDISPKSDYLSCDDLTLKETETLLEVNE